MALLHRNGMFLVQPHILILTSGGLVVSETLAFAFFDVTKKGTICSNSTAFCSIMSLKFPTKKHRLNKRLDLVLAVEIQSAELSRQCSDITLLQRPRFS